MSSIDCSGDSSTTSGSEAPAHGRRSRTSAYSLGRRRGRDWASMAVIGFAALMTGAAFSEGAVRVLDCSVLRVCDGGGHCEAATGEVTFTMEPVDLAAADSARYILSYGDARAEMRASEAGPFVWSLGSERDALLASSETQWLWHTLVLAPAPEATIRFLQCSFRQ